MTTEAKTTPKLPEVAHATNGGDVPVFITKSNFFRVIHVDGFFGGGTPTPGSLMMTVYSHRISFPERTAINETGGEVVSKRVSHDGIEHEYEASLVMSLATAQAMHSWLGNVISQTENGLKMLKLIQHRDQPR
jgi:hypothetical protein